MGIVIVRKKELVTKSWAGGTTTQLFIFPPEAEYTQFNFICRMSYATVEVEESTFTFMPGVTRHLMILKGQLEIDHAGRYKKTLEPFARDIFNGEWPTTAKGKVTDFNLMTRENAKGNLSSLIMEKGETKRFDLSENRFTGLFVWKGEIITGKEKLNEGDFLLAENETEINLLPVNGCELIVAAIKI